MNTPAHVILSSVVLGRGARRTLWLPITLGALLPDLPMLGFYVYQRLGIRVPEQLIWTELYFDPDWQAFFDVFNSLPLIGLAALIAWRAGSHAWLALFLSRGLHCLGDLPLHREDAHGHFYPLTSWRFVSPVSYWDPRFHGASFALLEVVLSCVGGVVLWRRAGAWRWVGATTLALYAAFIAFAVAVWLGGGLPD